MSAFSYDKHHSFLLDSSLMFLIPDTPTTTNMSCFSEQSIHNIHKPCFSPHQHHPFYDQADPTVEILPSVNLHANSTSTTKISTCENNTSSSAVPVQYHQVNNPMEKRINNFLQPHSKVLLIISNLISCYLTTKYVMLVDKTKRLRRVRCTCTIINSTCTNIKMVSGKTISVFPGHDLTLFNSVIID